MLKTKPKTAKKAEFFASHARKHYSFKILFERVAEIKSRLPSSVH